MSEKTTPPPAVVVSGKRSFKTISIWLPAELVPAARAVARHGRDVQNTAVFLLRSAFDSYRWDPSREASVLKPEGARPKGSAEALAAFNAGILALNADRAAKGSKSGHLESLGESVENLSGALLDQTLFERVVKARPDLLALDRKPAFGRLPSKLSRGFCEAARGGFSTWLKSVKAWGAAGGAGGRPGMPGYQEKKSLPPIEIGCFGLGFPKLAGKALFIDEPKTIQLTAKQTAPWDAFRLRPFLERALAGRWGRADQRPGHWAKAPGLSAVKALRIVVEGKRARLQIMAEVEPDPPPGSFYAELAAREPAGWAKLWPGKRRSFDAWLAKLAAGQDWLAAARLRPLRQLARRLAKPAPGPGSARGSPAAGSTWAWRMSPPSPSPTGRRGRFSRARRLTAGWAGSTRRSTLWSPSSPARSNGLCKPRETPPRRPDQTSPLRTAAGFASFPPRSSKARRPWLFEPSGGES